LGCTVYGLRFTVYGVSLILSLPLSLPLSFSHPLSLSLSLFLADSERVRRVTICELTPCGFRVYGFAFTYMGSWVAAGLMCQRNLADSERVRSVRAAFGRRPSSSSLLLSSLELSDTQKLLALAVWRGNRNPHSADSERVRSVRAAVGRRPDHHGSLLRYLPFQPFEPFGAA